MNQKIKKASRKALVAKLDNIFSIYIRLLTKREYGPYCPFCHKQPISCCFHFVTRSKHIVRWDRMNAIGSCFGCNYKNEFNPHPFVQWYLKKYGQDEYDKLLFKSNQIAKFDRSDLEDLYKDIKSRIEYIK